MQNILNIVKDNKKFLWGIFFLALVLRVIFFSVFLKDHRNRLNVDSWQYSIIGKEIAAGNGISLRNGPQFYRVPGYPIFLSLSYKLFGFYEKKALWLQLFFASFIPILLFLLSLVLVPGRLLLAKIVSMFSVVHIGFLTFAGLLMTETFFAIFFLMFYIFFFSGNQFWAGLFLGVSSLFRPVGHYAIVLAILILLIFSSRRWQETVYIFSGWFLVVFWWLLRNFLLTGYIFFHSLPGTHFLHHFVSRVVMEKEQVSYVKVSKKVFGEYRDLIKEEEKGLGRPLLEIESCILGEKIAKKYFLENLFLSIKFSVINMVKTCFSLYSAELLFVDSKGALPEYSATRSWKDFLSRFLLPKVSNKFLYFVIYAEMFFFFLILVGFFGWLYGALIAWNWIMPLKVLLFIGLFVFISSACGFARLRLPVEPFVIIFSLSFWLEKIKRGDCFNES